MAKKGFFSWFRKDKTKEQERVAQEQRIAEEQAAEALAKEQAIAAEEAERLAEQERAAEAERIAEQQRLAEELRLAEAEQARIAVEAERIAEQERLAEELRLAEAEQARIAAEAERIAEQERLAEELRLAEAEEERIAAEAEHVAEQQRLIEERSLAEAEEAHLAAKAEREAEQQRLAVEQQKLAEEQRLVEAEEARITAEAERVAELQRLEAEKQRLAEERSLAEAEEQARLAAEAEAARIALEAERAAEQQRLADQEQARLAAEAEAADVEQEQVDEPQAKPVKEGLFARLKRGLLRTSENIGSGFMGIFRGKKIDDDLFEELEEQLLIADVGVETTTRLIDNLTSQASRKQLKDAEALYDLLRDELQTILDPVAVPLVPENADGPFVILMVGVNGVGKTTTIGKLAKQYQKQGKSVMLAAGDTFRAAAVEQLQVWGQRNDIPVIAQHTGADSASVLFDALQAAKARNVDVLIADTAGRLQNKSHLMEELKKVVRVMKKLDPNAPHEVMLTLDASTGQNAISQAQLFQEAVGVTGITISKLDGTAKGGVIFAIADKFNIPIRHIGVGEQIDDLRTFNSSDFIEALFSQEKAE
ncbi:signal recognition particle-docking protein FtsY [Shewanella sp. 10N.286.48.B5]|uniref:signal recognition particle-docking protein FtsY n=1 Tax=Shewanella sp. 10N.286.48.B5 TaxID=1880834 RepID=UPI0039A5BDB7